MNPRKRLPPQVDSAFYGDFPSLRAVQEAAIKPILDGKNVVACSGTGSGKTEAALAPLVSRYWDDFEKIDSTLVIYIAPTKALVNDLARRLEISMKKMRLRYGVRHGDKDDIKGRKKRPHVLITTPESLDVMLFREDKALETVKALVIDEVHLLYNTQRGLHLAILIDRLRKTFESKRLQLVALSATIAKLEEVGNFFFGSGENMELLEYPAHREIDAQVRPGDYVSVVQELTDSQKGKCKLLAFANRRKTCEELAQDLSRAHHLRDAVFTHYSSLSPSERENIEAKFTELETAVCNATSTLELGIDIGDIDAVLLCDVPASTDSFLQRIGRGNRRSNKTVAICFVGMEGEDLASQNTNALRYLALISAARKGELSSRGTYELFGAVAQQCLSVIASREEFVSIKSLMDTFEKIRYLNRASLELIVTNLVDLGYLRQQEGKKKYGPTDDLHKLVKARRIYGNFPAGTRMVKLLHGVNVLGEVPQFNLEKIGEGSLILFAARKWKISKITPSTDPEVVEVEPYDGKEPYQSFQYRGMGIGFETFLNDKMWETIHGEDFPERLFTGGELRKTVTQARDSARNMCKIDEIPCCAVGKGNDELNFRYYTFGGLLINRALGLITKQKDFQESDLCLDVHSPIDWKVLPSNPHDYRLIFENMFRPSADQSIFQKMLPEELQVREYTQEWLKDDAIRQVLSRLASSAPVDVSLGDWPFH